MRLLQYVLKTFGHNSIGAKIIERDENTVMAYYIDTYSNSVTEQLMKDIGSVSISIRSSSESRSGLTTIF